MNRAVRVTRVAASLIFVLCFPVLTGAQPPTFRAGTELVNLNVTVVGPNAQPVEGLTADQFEVFEDGVQQDVQFFAPGEMPLDVVILLDTSSSMGSSLGLVQAAAVRFARALRDGDRASVMGISGGLRILQPFTVDKTLITAAIRETRPSGRTPLYASIYAALRELDEARESYDTPRRQAMVVLSDGQDTASGFGFDELLDSVRRQAVPIYTIAPRPSPTIMAHREMAFGETTREQDFELRRLAIETGARAFFPVVLQQLAGVYQDIANELAHQYSLGYESSNAGVDGGFRRIGLRVAAPGVKWRTRAGYIAIGDAAVSGSELR
jgi:Ca-activated chloride channel family protein